MSMSTSTLNKSSRAHKPTNNRCNSANSSSNSKTTMTMMKMRRRCQVLTTRINMQTCPSHLSSKKCLSTFSDTSPRKLIWKPRSSHSFLTTSQLLVKLMLSWRCQSQMDRRKTWVSLSLTNHVWITKTRPYWNWNTFKARMLRALPQLMSTLSIKRIRSLAKSAAGSAVCKICTRHVHHPLLITRRICLTLNP